MNKRSAVHYPRPVHATGGQHRGWHEQAMPSWIPHNPQTWDATRWVQAQDGPRALAKQR